MKESVTYQAIVEEGIVSPLLENCASVQDKFCFSLASGDSTRRAQQSRPHCTTLPTRTALHDRRVAGRFKLGRVARNTVTGGGVAIFLI